jgi:LPXTG-motif cell wall-anchored protein
MSDTVLAILMLAGLALSGGAALLFKRGQRKQAGLMLLAALVMFANVAIWLAPLPKA